MNVNVGNRKYKVLSKPDKINKTLSGYELLEKYPDKVDHIVSKLEVVSMYEDKELVIFTSY